MIILIGGVPRSGKTILAQTISSKQHMSMLHLDTLRTMFEGAMPALGIMNGNEPNVNAKRMWPFIKVFTAAALQDGEDYIIEGSDLLPAFVHELLPANNIRAIFLGYTTVPTDTKVNLIRSHPTANEWTATMPRTELNKLVATDIERSHYLQDQCTTYGIPYYELADDFATNIATAAEQLLGTPLSPAA